MTDPGPAVEAQGDPPSAERVTALLDFLEAYYRLARPPLRDISGYSEFLLRKRDLPETPNIVLSPAADHWLVATLVAHGPKPPVPEALHPWVEPNTLSPIERPEIQLGEDPDESEFEAALALEEWAEKVWKPWAEGWRTIEESRAFYKRLYALRARLERDRDGYELVWAFGRLRWVTNAGAVDHPLVTVGVEILLDDSGRLSIVPSASAEVEAAFLADVELANNAEYLASRREGAAAGIDLWNEDSRLGLLTRLLRSISHDGAVADTPPVGGEPVLTDEWVLYLRRRQADYVGFLEQQRDLYRAGAQPALPLHSLVVDRPSELTRLTTPGGEASLETQWADSTLYLPKEANEEQHRILALAGQRAGVTAQGPPGTGKSHTIANLICHFVAEGKRVLVTAEKEQALAVLSEKLPPAVRELSVTVGGGDSTSYTRLEHAVTAIQTRVSTFEQDEVAAQISRCTTRVAEIDASIADTTNRLRSARQAEAIRLSGVYEAGDDPSPSEVAAWLASTECELAFIPDALGLDQKMPLGGEEWAELIRLRGQLAPSDVDACAHARPPTSALPSGASLGRQFAELDDLRARLADLDDRVASWERLDTSADKLDGLITAVREAADWRRKISGGWLDRVRLESTEDLGRTEWEEFEAGILAAREQAVVQRRLTAAHDVSIPDDPSVDLQIGLREARERFAAGKGISRVLNRVAAKALEACKVDGQAPATAEQVDLCVAALRRVEQQQELTSRWRNGTARVGGPDLGSERPAEDAVAEHLEGITRAIQWGRGEWPALQAAVRGVGLRSPANAEVDDLDRLAEALVLASERVRERALSAGLDGTRSTISQGSGPDRSVLWSDLADAFATRRWELWDRTVHEARRLEALEPDVRRYNELGSQLRKDAPRFADVLLSSNAVDLPPHAQVVRAWQWRQLESWLAATSRGPSTGELQRKLEQLSADRLRQMERLVVARAWQGLATKFTEDNRSALNKYLTAVKRFGKTGGKYADRWRREIREALDESKSAIPVWIMPTARVLESFRPATDPPFDVLIVDEASQIGLFGLPVLALAKRAIVVGDDQQTSPENVGLDRQAVFNLIDAHLGGIGDARTLFDADNSLYDASRQKFPEVVVLREHFRCLPQIIAFSNGRYYGGQMVPLRDRPPTPTWRSVGTVFVPDGFRDGRDVNEPEALAAVDLIAELVSDASYDGMTFGFIALLGRGQSLRVQELLLDRLGPDVLEDRRIRCGEAADFQGDERDVMVISTVVDRPEGRRIGSFTDRKSERRLNVAASRAKNQLWVIHSIEPEDFPNGDPRAELVRHCQNPLAVEAAYSNLEQRCDSQFEKDVLKAILQRGYRRVRTQHEVGRYRIDIVIEGPQSRLAVECDGDRWHGAERWDADRSRQQILQRSGWTFERVRGSAFYRDPEGALQCLWQRLEELGIPTGEWGAADGPELSVRRVAPTMAERRDAVTRAPGESTGVPLADLAAEPAPLDDDRTEAYPLPDERNLQLPLPDEPSVSQLEQFVRTESSGDEDGREVLHPGSGARDPNRGVPAPGPGAAIHLSPHREWARRRVAPVLNSPSTDVIDELAEIVEVEGPLLALRLYQIHTKASGGARVGREMKQTYNKLVSRAVRDGLLAQLGDSISGQIEKTIYAPGSSPVVLRDLGPRQLHEVPKSEIRTLADLLGARLEDGEAGLRAILGAYGLKKLTQKTEAYLVDCLSYSWTER